MPEPDPVLLAPKDIVLLLHEIGVLGRLEKPLNNLVVGLSLPSHRPKVLSGFLCELNGRYGH